MLKKLIIFAIAVMPLAAFAQQQSKLAYINTNEVFSAMPELKDVETKLSAKQEEIKKTLGDIEAEYNKKVEEFKASKETPSANVVADRQKQLEQLQERYQAFAQTSDTEFQQLRQSLLTPVQQKLQEAIKAVGQAQGYTYILEASTLPYIGDGAVNVGPLVKARLGIK